MPLSKIVLSVGHMGKPENPLDRGAIYEGNPGVRLVEAEICLEAASIAYKQLTTAGYVTGGNPVTPETPNWKSKIPIIHKSQVVNHFNEVYLAEDEDDEKNSEVESGKQ